jgi:large subunit ribosomal protein L24
MLKGLNTQPKSRTTKLRIKKDDEVFILAGKDRGSSGKVLEVDPISMRATVEGINIVKRHRKESKQTGGGGITDMPAPLHVSNLVVICPHCRAHTRPIKRTVEKTHGGQKKRFHVRVCRKCSESLDKI